MKSFGYCVWFLIDDNRKHTFTDMKFLPHITIEKHINFDVHYLKKFPKNKSYSFRLGTPIQTKDENFYAFQYPVHVVDASIPNWFEKESHLSVHYDYDKEIDIHKDVPESLQNLSGTVVTGSKVAVFLCNGHYDSWERVI